MHDVDDERGVDAAPRAGRGRPRDERLDERVLAATRSSLEELGWERTSVRGVAERSGVSRPAIARRWPSKAHLVLAAILGETPDLDAFQDVDMAGWIDGVVDGSFALFDRSDVRAAAPGLLATLRDHEDIRAALWDGFSGPASVLAVEAQRDSGTDAPDSTAADDHLDDARLLDARAAIVLAAGSALFLSLVAGADDRLRRRVETVLGTAMTDLLDPQS